MRSRFQQFQEWGRIGGRLRQRRLLKAKNRRYPALRQIGRPEVSTRNQDILRMFRERPTTLEEIGAHFGITRERVRQILEKQGVKHTHGRLHNTRTANKLSKSARKERARETARELSCQQQLGCSRETYYSLTGIRWRNHIPGPGRDYYQQWRTAVITRNIEWELTFPEWWAIWQKSGKYEMRGRGQQKYVMARYGDKGPYAIDNVFICLSVENNSERAKKHSLPRGVHIVRNKFQANKMINGQRYYIGLFDTAEEAHEAYLTFTGPSEMRK